MSECACAGGGEGSQRELRRAPNCAVELRWRIARARLQHVLAQVLVLGAEVLEHVARLPLLGAEVRELGRVALVDRRRRRRAAARRRRRRRRRRQPAGADRLRNLQDGGVLLAERLAHDEQVGVAVRAGAQRRARLAAARHRLKRSPSRDVRRLLRNNLPARRQLHRHRGARVALAVEAGHPHLREALALRGGAPAARVLVLHGGVGKSRLVTVCSLQRARSRAAVLRSTFELWRACSLWPTAARSPRSSRRASWAGRLA